MCVVCVINAQAKPLQAVADDVERNPKYMKGRLLAGKIFNKYEDYRYRRVKKDKTIKKNEVFADVSVPELDWFVRQYLKASRHVQEDRETIETAVFKQAKKHAKELKKQRQEYRNNWYYERGWGDKVFDTSDEEHELAKVCREERIKRTRRNPETYYLAEVSNPNPVRSSDVAKPVVEPNIESDGSGEVVLQASVQLISAGNPESGNS
jgi:hypothetical protein